MKNTLKGIALVLFGILLVMFQISYDPYYVDMDIPGLIVGVLGVLLILKDDILKLLNKLNENENKKDGEKETGGE